MPTQLDLHHLAAQLASDGPHAHEAALRAVAEWAGSVGAPAVLANLVACADEPPIARLRAFGLLVRTLQNTSERVLPQPVMTAPEMAA